MTGTPTGADDAEPRRQRLIQQLRRLGWPPYVVVAITLTIAVVCIGLVVSGRAQDGTDVILLVAGFGAGVIALMALIVLAYQVRHMARDPEDVGRPGIIDYLILGALPFLVLVGGVLTYYAISQSDIKLPDQLSTTFFLAFSVIALLLSLSMTAIFFSWVKLSDPKQALGLPEGSVRAVIALSLIIIFSITAVFLYTQVSNSSILTSTGLTADQVALIPASERLDTTAEALPTPDPAATPLPPGATPTPAEQTFTVRRIDPAQRTGNELAQQIVTTVSTLVVAVSAFYFGSSSVKSATEALAAATAGVGMKVSAPRQRSRLRRENGKFSLVDVVVDSTPPNQAIIGEILSGDLDGKIAQTDPGAFTYSPVNPEEKVLLRFALVADQTTNATLVLLRDEETPSATGSGAKRSPESPDDGGDATDGKGEFEPPPGGPPPGGPHRAVQHRAARLPQIRSDVGHAANGRACRRSTRSCRRRSTATRPRSLLRIRRTARPTSPRLPQNRRSRLPNRHGPTPMWQGKWAKRHPRRLRALRPETRRWGEFSMSVVAGDPRAEASSPPIDTSPRTIGLP